uniref:Cupin type-1 domain-containing protein n=1 Tax=Nelumbo nucifera TaxID=4432 RepID=A0A822YMW8_NELNU|nr:TPA_asm: hypothetical protein HUJ06_011097 [Nelumbo nucifera]
MAIEISKALNLLFSSSIYPPLLISDTDEGSLMGPYSNPITTEIVIVIHGQGMDHIVCSSPTSESDCKNKWFKVIERNVFAISPFHLTTQILFNNNLFVIMGFNTMAKKNHLEFLGGKS